MKNIVISITASTSEVKTNKMELGVAGEHLQSQFIIDFTDEFIDGTATLEYKKASGSTGFIELNKGDKVYSAGVIEELTKEQQEIKFQVKIVQEATETGTPIFKSKVFALYVGESINASEVMG